jgi:S1-C subfamily serine protease
MGQCLISGVQAGSAADKAGLRPQDIIVEIDGRPVPDFNACTELIGQHGPGETVKLLVERRQPDGKAARFSQTVELGGW